MSRLHKKGTQKLDMDKFQTSLTCCFCILSRFIYTGYTNVIRNRK